MRIRDLATGAIRPYFMMFLLNRTRENGSNHRHGAVSVAISLKVQSTVRFVEFAQANAGIRTVLYGAVWRPSDMTLNRRSHMTIAHTIKTLNSMCSLEEFRGPKSLKAASTITFSKL